MVQAYCVIISSISCAEPASVSLQQEQDLKRLFILPFLDRFPLDTERADNGQTCKT